MAEEKVGGGGGYASEGTSKIDRKFQPNSSNLSPVRHDRSHVLKINRNVLLERSNPSCGILYPGAISCCESMHNGTRHGNPISDRLQKRLRMSRVAKIYRLIDVPWTAHRLPNGEPTILDFVPCLPNARPTTFYRFIFHPSVAHSSQRPTERSKVEINSMKR